MDQTVRGLSLLIVLSFLLALFSSGCTENRAEPAAEAVKTQSADGAASRRPGTSEPVELRMYLIGDKSRDFDLVYAELNKLLKKDINATIDADFMGWDDYMQKYSLAFSSGDDFDLIFTANWCLYNNQALKGGFTEITWDMLQQYAPETAASIYKDAWEQAKVNGKVYMLPMNYKELNAYVYLVRGDLMDKYGIAEIKDENDFETYLDAVAKNEKNLIPLDIGSDMDFDTVLRFEVLAPLNLEYLEPQQRNHFFGLSGKNSAKIINILETPEFLAYAKKMKKWKDRGYWSQSALVNKVTSNVSFRKGLSASAIINLNTANGTYASAMAAHPEWDVKTYDGMKGGGISIKPFIQNGMGINANSRYPQRALMFLDLVRNDERYADLVTYGIKGRHYDLTEDGKVRPLAETANYPIDNNCNWGWRDDRFIKQIEGGLPNYGEILTNWEKTAYTHPVQYFAYDDSEMKEEVAAVESLWKTEYKVVALGFTENSEEAVRKLIQSYRNAGNDKLIQDEQRQVDKYMEELKK
jgi:putative aldouronate transport system substrate-binding protein